MSEHGYQCPTCRAVHRTPRPRVRRECCAEAAHEGILMPVHAVHTFSGERSNGNKMLYCTDGMTKQQTQRMRASYTAFGYRCTKITTGWKLVQ